MEVSTSSEHENRVKKDFAEANASKERSSLQKSEAEISLHPLVIMNISEHWTRLRAQNDQRQSVQVGPLRIVIDSSSGGVVFLFIRFFIFSFCFFVLFLILLETLVFFSNVFTSSSSTLNIERINSLEIKLDAVSDDDKGIILSQSSKSNWTLWIFVGYAGGEECFVFISDDLAWR